jgi:eukaryotic-like serine/threonine-protein kinase
MSSARPAKADPRSNAALPPSTPIGVRTRHVVSGRWVAVALAAALGLAALVFLMVPRWLSPTREAAPPPAVPAPPPAVTPAAEPARAVPDPALGPPSEQAQARETPAKSAPTRVEPRPTAPRFEALMTDGLAQLERREWSAAEQSFGAALKLQPADRSAADGLARAKDGLQRDALARLQREAQALESAERWDAALAAYRSAAAIDPTVDFAREGGARSARMIALQARLDGYLADPSRLYSPRVRDEAQQLLASLGREPAGGPRFAQAKERLAAALARATATVDVVLTSDNATEVTIHRVGSLGRFQSRAVALSPGRYTLVGSRPGYKDVRVEVTVDPDSPPPQVVIVCEERV